MEIFRPADFREQPWKNGGGTTRELLRAPHPHDAGKFAWRVSCATVATSGPFSIFPGVDRTLMLLDGDGFALRGSGEPEVALTERGQQIRFSGDLSTDCRLLGGPSRDFNLMVDRTLFRGELAWLRPGRTSQLLVSAPLCLLYVLEGTIALSTPGSDGQSLLNAGELGRLQTAKSLHLATVSTDSLVVKVDLFGVTAPRRETRKPAAAPIRRPEPPA